MKERKGYSIPAIGVACFFIALGGILAAGGLLDAAGSQDRQWAKIITAFLSFSGGFLFIEVEVRRVKRRFSDSVAKREHELGRFLLGKEREYLKEAMRAAVPGSGDSPSFSHPVVRIVARISIVTMPATVLMGVLAAGGAFFAGFGLAILGAELTRRTLSHL